jgi:glutaredoxin
MDVPVKPAAQDAAAAAYTVYVQPGCSSCLRTKEFLARHGVPHRVVDVMNDPVGMAELRALGLRHVPIVARGGDYVYGQNVDDVARFTGVGAATQPRLAPAALFERWSGILEHAAGLVRQLPAAHLDERPIPGRDGTIRNLAWHVFLIPQAFMDAVERERPDWIENSMQPALAAFLGEDIAREGLRIRDELLAFEQRRRVREQDTVVTFQGAQSLHWFLERSTWHSAQHTRQLADVLQRLGIEAAPPPAQLTDGLPLPQRVWE